MKTFSTCVVFILTLLGASCGSGNTKEAYWTNWTWQNTFDLMITLWMLNYCAIAVYLAFKFTGEAVGLASSQRDNNREWLHQLKLERKRAAQPNPWRQKQKKKRRKKQGEW